MSLTSADWAAIWLTIELASLTTLLLLVIGTPIAWWLARTRSRLKGPVGAIVALPLVLPPRSSASTCWWPWGRTAMWGN